MYPSFFIAKKSLILRLFILIPFITCVFCAEPGPDGYLAAYADYLGSPKSVQKKFSPSPQQIQIYLDGLKSSRNTNHGQTDLTDKVQQLEQEIRRLETTLTYLLPMEINSEADYIKKAFRDRLQTHLTGCFSTHKINSEQLNPAVPKALLGIKFAQPFIGCIPAAAAAPINTVFEAASHTSFTSPSNTLTPEDVKDKYYTFSSFAAIDKASYYIAQAITIVYEEQIEQLTPQSAINLADSAGHTLKWYIENKEKQTSFQEKIVMPDELILALGQYYKKGQDYVKLELNKPTPKLLRSSPLSSWADDDTSTWYDFDVFLMSGLKVIEIAPEDIITEKIYENPSNSCLYLYKPFDKYTSNVYLMTSTKAKKYGYRHVNEKYLEIMQYHINCTRRINNHATLPKWEEIKK